MTAETSLAARLLEDNFGRADGGLTIGGVAVADLARTYGTPLYIFDAELMRRNYRALSAAVAGFAEVFYSIKANPNPEVAKVFVAEGAGLEIASAKEFAVAVSAGCKPERILFAGPGKGEAELETTLKGGLGEVHLESYEEIAIVGRIAREMGKRLPVAIRVNPEQGAQGGAMRMGGKPAAFGFDEETLEDVIAKINAEEVLDVAGVHLFAGTQILDAKVLLTQWGHGLALAARVAGMTGRTLHTIDLGGGLGVPYHNGDAALDLAAVAAGAPELARIKNENPLLRDARVVLEPGRFLVGNTGMYVMRTRAVKMSRGARFVITDGGMHHHLAASGNLGQVVKRDYPIVAAEKLDAAPEGAASLVGPLCTPLDTLGRQVAFPAMAAGDLVAVLQSGAYGLTASPNGFLSHPTPAEVLVDRGSHHVIRAAGAS